MNVQSRKTYPSTQFAALNDGISVASARKNYLIWITLITLLFCAAGGYLYYELIFSPSESKFNISSVIIKNHTVNVNKPWQDFPKFNSELFLGHRKKPGESSCYETSFTGIIPSIFVDRVFKEKFESIYDYINVDLLLHYENIINKYELKSLKLIFNEYQVKLLSVKNSDDFIDFMRSLNSNKFTFYASYLSERKMVLDFKRFEDFFTMTFEFNHWYNYVNELPKYLSSYEQQKLRSFNCCTGKNFKGFIEESQKALFRFVFPFHATERKLQEVLIVINQWNKPVSVSLADSSVTYYGAVIRIGEVNKKLHNFNVSNLKNVHIFASDIVFLDEDIELLGVDLAIVAPHWVFLKVVNININGLPAEEFENNASGYDAGKPGKPGGNAGNFIGIGNPVEKYLNITANGGWGGGGQNGAVGRHGVDNTHPDPPVDKPACLDKVQTLYNTFGQRITQYKIYSRIGCGGPGSDGGAGGIGGLGGSILLLNKNTKIVNNGSNGAPGSPGRGGPGGLGGHNGCYYEGLDVNDEVLHRVTRVKCSSGNILPSGPSGRDGFNRKYQVFPTLKEHSNVHNILINYLTYVEKLNDDNVILLVNSLNQTDIFNYTNNKDIITDFTTFYKYNLLDIFQDKIQNYRKFISSGTQVILQYLRTITLGKQMLSKTNIRFYFIDRNSLNVFKKSIKSTNEQTRELLPLIYLDKKIEAKLEGIKLTLKKIKMKSAFLDLDNKNFINNFGISPSGNRRILCIMIKTLHVMEKLLNQTSTDLLLFCSIIRNPLKAGIENQSLSTLEKIVFELLEKLTSDKTNVRENLINLKKMLFRINELDVSFEETKKLFETLLDELERFVEIYDYIEWRQTALMFSESLRSLPLEDKYGDIKLLKKLLIDVMIDIQYQLAINSVEPYVYSFAHLHPRTVVNSSVEEILSQLNLLENKIETSLACKNIFKAVFDKNSAVGEFFSWPNSDIRKKLSKLFQGAEIDLKANLINRHIFDKNLIHFFSVKLDFECFNNGEYCGKALKDILDNFKLEMTHSGYSYYNWNEEKHIVISEKVSLEYSFKMRDENKPEIYNVLYKKCEDGEIKLSPYTIWTIRLLPINNKADFSKLSSFVNAVNLRLIGTGTYIA